ncbi:MAG TPA: S53 family peptidase [Gemmatimonadaceae bacterium]|jgi:kumamolisin
MTARRHVGMPQLAGTDTIAIENARRVRTWQSTEPLTLTLHLRSRAEDPNALEQAFEDIIAGRRPTLDRKTFADEFGARRDDVTAIRRFAKEKGFQVKSLSAAKRIVRLSGTRGQLGAAFGVNTVRYTLSGATWNSFVGPLYLPPELESRVIAVLGFDDKPELSRHRAGAMAAAAPKPKISYTAPEVGNLYRFPEHLDGEGQTIGVIALGGGYRPKDMRTYFHALELPAPQIRSRSVNGVRNAPEGDTKAYDGEVTGDVQTVGAIAPKAKIVVYFAPNTTRGFFEAVSEAVHDRHAKNTVISISWGQAEEHWKHAELEAFNRVLMEAAILGITVCCSSGDHGVFADVSDRTAHVNFPASSPYSLACGGTSLIGRERVIKSERVWNNETGASGGGVSAKFSRPAWQKASRIPKTAQGFQGRGVPDVAANADPLTGYRVFLDGKWGVGAGTSAAAPLWAGLVARMNQGRGTPIGLLTAAMYAEYDRLRTSGAIVPVTRGSDGLYRARRGWDCCTGLGTPRGDILHRAFEAPRGKRQRGDRT